MEQIKNETMSKINNTILTGANKLQETIKNTSEKLLGPDNVVASNYALTMAIFIVFVVLMILFFLSKSFRASRTIDTIKMYHRYQTIQSFPYRKAEDIRLGNCYVASSYNPTLVGFQMYDYTSESVLRSILRSGARYLEFSIFNSRYGKDAYPIVSNGFRVGEWKMTINAVSFEACCKVIAENAFIHTGEEGRGSPNYNDPLFIGLNLKTNNNTYCLDLIADIIIDYFRERLLDHKYSFQYTNLANARMGELKQKVVIISSTGYEGSKLDELVNGSWDKSNIRRIHYSDLENTEFNINKMVKYNKENLTIVVPHNEGDFWTSNYNSLLAFKSGCQFVAMNYQRIDTSMDAYITKFRYKGITFKPRRLVK